MSNTKIDLLGMPIDEGERTRAVASLKSLSRLMRDRKKCLDSVEACKRSITAAKNELADIEKDRPANTSAEKAARQYAEEAMKYTADPRVVFKNMTIFVLWLAIFGYLMIINVMGKAFPGMYVQRDISHYLCLLAAYGVNAIGVFGSLCYVKSVDKDSKPSGFFAPAFIVSVITAIPAGIFYGTAATNVKAFSITFDQIVGYTLPALLVGIVALLLSAVLDIPMAKLKPSKKQEEEYRRAYASELERLTAENKGANKKFEKALREANGRLSSLYDRLAKAEEELAKADEALERNDIVPEFYKDREIVSELILSIEASFAGSIFNSVRLYEQQRAQKMLMKYQEAVASEARAKEESEYTQGYMTVQMHDAGGREKTIADIQRRIKQNNDMANDIYRACGSDKRV